MTAPERETAGSVRSAHVAYFLPPNWARVARRTAPALERITRDLPHVQLLVLVPDAGAALALARAMATLKQADGVRVVAATSAARTTRLLSGEPAHVIIGAPSTLAPVLSTASLKLDQVATVMFAAADELDAESPELATVLAEVPRTATRVLTALHASPGVEAILERYLHRARRVQDDVAPAADAPAAVSVRYHTVSGSPLEALALVLDEVDAPSATILATDAATGEAARVMLRSIGYAEDGLARVSEGDVRPNSALVVTLGVPTATAWAAAVAAQPAQIVSIITPRDLAALQLLAGTSAPQPFVARAAVLRARASDARMRAELREALGQGIPSREVLALEPLLGEYDGLEIAAAALRLLERTRATQTELVNAAEIRVRAIMKEAQREAVASAGTGSAAGAPADRDARPRFGSEGRDKPRFGSDRGDRPRPSDRGERPRFGERSDRPRSTGDKPRFSDRSDRPRSTGDKPRFSDRSDKPRSGPRAGGDKPRFGGDKPRFGADKPRFGGDKPRGAGPRSTGPRGPRRDDAGGRPPRDR